MNPTQAGLTTPPNNDDNSLENPTMAVEPSSKSSPGNLSANQAVATGAPPPLKTPNPYKSSLFQKIARKINVYLLVFFLLIFVSIVIIVIALTAASKANKTNGIAGKPLSEGQLAQLATTGTTIGSSSQVLNIAASTVFSNQILARQSLDVAGSLKVGGTLSSAAITASGTSNFQQLATSGLVVNGAITADGSLTVSQNLTVDGTGSFNGILTANQLNVQTLQLNGDLTLNHHIVVGGSTPTSSPGDALGSGGTASLSGSDSAGTINVNTGSSPASGCFISITFSHTYNHTPYVSLTPIGSAGAGLNLYAQVSATGLSVCSSTGAPQSSSFSIDYIVIG
jgi:cytoskeletal protein CcmA (bactofilin family)